MRFLLIVENPGFTPQHREYLLGQLRKSLPVISVRVATRHVEVDLKTDDLENAKKKVEEVVGGSVLEVVDITFEAVQGGLGAFIKLFNEERFWEAHVALEEEWRATRSPTLQGLIMLAAAYVKLQEGRVDKFEALLKEAYGLLQEDVGCLKVEYVKRAAEIALVNRQVFKLECL